MRRITGITVYGRQKKYCVVSEHIFDFELLK
jgi:hypothetical protein